MYQIIFVPDGTRRARIPPIKTRGRYHGNGHSLGDIGGAFLAKSVGQTVDDDFSASMVKISRFSVGNLRNVIVRYIAHGHHDHFEPKNSKPS